jgi:hypothetical protein
MVSRSCLLTDSGKQSFYGSFCAIEIMFNCYYIVDFQVCHGLH